MLRYNHLNLPVDVYFGNGQRQTIEYLGNGAKHSVCYSQTSASIVGGNVPADDRYSVTSTRTYVGPHVFEDGHLAYSAFGGGYFDPSGGTMYYLTDWQGNNVKVLNAKCKTQQTVHYYPYGEPTVEPSGQSFLYGGKEREHAGGRNSYDFSARCLISPIGQWGVPDRQAESFYPYSPYSYCASDPINNIDPDGKAWYSTTKINFDPIVDQFEFIDVILYTPYDKTDFYKKINDSGAQYLGDIAVVFDGSYDERLATDGTIDGEGAVNAAVTVYGPRGEDDIDYYIGFTMTSDFELFGAIDDGEYDVMYTPQGKTGKLKSHYAVNNKAPVNCLNGVNPSPPEYHPYSSTQKDKIYVHATNYNGYAGHNRNRKVAVSTGCPLIHGAQWARFERQIGRSSFKMIINRK